MPILGRLPLLRVRWLKPSSCPSVRDLTSASADAPFFIGAGPPVVFWISTCENMTGIPARKAIGASRHASSVTDMTMSPSRNEIDACASFRISRLY